MNGEIEIKVNASKALNFLSRFSTRVQRNAQRATEEGAKGVYNTAKRLAPVDTGFLRDNIVLEKRGNGAVVRSKAYYSKFVIGKRYRRGPYQGNIIDYMNQAEEQNKDNIMREMRKAIKRSIGLGV